MQSKRPARTHGRGDPGIVAWIPMTWQEQLVFSAVVGEQPGGQPLPDRPPPHALSHAGVGVRHNALRLVSPRIALPLSAQPVEREHLYGASAID
jgi:hypothetical protein